MTPQPAKYPLLTPRTKRVAHGSRRLPHGHRFCAVHPDRYLPSISRAGVRCWLCEPKDPVFAELDALIALGIDVPQLRITPEMVEEAEARKTRRCV